ncbi:LPS export ABC transporter periplasmic protein LptC [Thalassobellus citreus]|uniref:LPS export ABC transporter periplasmic protein LptC n=1 Tax=Thalassobellus citreus TaxID=3367752 RepID=UPI0037AFDAEF
MSLKNIYIINIVTVFTVAMFFSCTNGLKKVQQVGVSKNEPASIVENFNVKYIDSGRVAANLLSVKMLDYTNRDFPYREFVEGVTLYVFDESNRKHTILSDYAIVYEKTSLIDLQKNVKIITSDNDTLFTEQLYYKPKKNWLFTNIPFVFKTHDGSVLKGNVLDTDKEFKKLEIIEFNDSDIAVED